MSPEEIFAREVWAACDLSLQVLAPRKKLSFRPMVRRTIINTKKTYVIGRTSLKTGLITIDIFTPTKREPKKISSVLRTLCHEVAHHQKPPFRQFFRWRWIIRQHYPEFYQQVNINIEVLKNHNELKKYFIE